MKEFVIPFLTAFALTWAGCSSEGGTGSGSSSGQSDSAEDAGTTSSGSGASDSGASDSGSSDSGASDSGASDSGSSDSGASDSGSSDSGSSDSGSSDSGSSDSGSSGSGTGSVVGSGSEDGTGDADGGTGDAGDTGSPDGTADTGASGGGPCDDCTDDEYCTPQEQCAGVGTCEVVDDCLDPGNSYPVVNCAGAVVCDEKGSCGWLCDDAGCTDDADCPATHFCSATQSGDKECKPYQVEGEPCGGFTPVWAQMKCSPKLKCTDFSPFLADAPGACRKPCADPGACQKKQYCASDGYCRDDGTCWNSAKQCGQSGNVWDAPACDGKVVCEDGVCGVDCSVISLGCTPEPGSCSVQSDCEDVCFAPGEDIGCGACQTAFDDACKDDGSCKAANPTYICDPIQCACDPNSDTICVPGCLQNADCETWEICGKDNRCWAQPCVEDSMCPPNFTCSPNGGCVRTKCVDSSVCNGCCVKGFCYDELGYCSPLPP